MDDSPIKTSELTGTDIKAVAAASMLLDHAAGAIIDWQLIYLPTGADAALLRQLSVALHCAGRIAFPLFVFLLVEGFAHTRSRARYLGRLAALALVSEFPFDLALMLWRSNMQAGIWWHLDHQNVVFTLAIGFLVIWACEKLLEKEGVLGTLGCPIAVIAGCWLARLIKTDYAWYGVLSIVGAYAARRMGKCDLAIPLSVIPLAFFSPFELIALLDWPLVHLYNGARGRMRGRAFYAFYPGHLLVLGIIRLLFVIPRV